MIKQILSTIACVGVGIAAASAVNEDFRDFLVETAEDAKKAFKGNPKVDAEPDEEPAPPAFVPNDVEEEEVSVEEMERAKDNIKKAAENLHAVHATPVEDIISGFELGDSLPKSSAPEIITPATEIPEAPVEPAE